MRPTYLDLHDRAMRQFDVYERMIALNQSDAARDAIWSACELETDAACHATSNHHTRAVLYRSAASFAYLAGRRELGGQLIEEGLALNPHPELASELQGLRDEPPQPHELLGL